MKLNADFSQRALVHFENDYVPSPMAGVDRHMLDRIGSEKARATTVVKYVEKGKFPFHEHSGGEEFLVLEGVFSDQHGNFGEGCYVRNPPTSSHEPWSDDGCVILVKLHQFDLSDRTQVHIDTRKMMPIAPRDREEGIRIIPLFSDNKEEVRLELWDPHSLLNLNLPKGAEIFVLEGSFTESNDTLKKWSWLRLPPGAALKAKAGDDGAKVWIKSGHLKDIDFARYEALTQR